MNSEWYVEQVPSEMATVLTHGPSGAKAWFYAYRHLSRQHVRQYPTDPFLALAAMITEGLKPYRVDGVMPQIESPLKALAN